MVKAAALGGPPEFAALRRDDGPEMTSADGKARPVSPATRLIRAGVEGGSPFVNPPVVHASTVLFESAEAMYSGKARWAYGRRGTPTMAALETAISDVSGATGTVLCPSGLSAVSTALLSFASAGRHVLMTDSVYGPTRHFAETVLARMGVATTFYDPRLPADAVGALCRPETAVIYAESPGSVTLEMEDVPGLARLAAERGLILVVDNTWATPLFCDVLALGADVAVLSATKYIGGHSDLMLGTISANPRAWPALKATHGSLGLCAGPDDIYLALRGLRTLDVRLRRHMTSGFAVAEWLAARPDVAAVLHPGLTADPGHARWQRDMTGAAGLFAFVLGGWREAEAFAFLNRLKLFGLGYSWGGFESLATLGSRDITPGRAQAAAAPIIRLSIGLEDPADLIADLAQALDGRFA